MYYSAEDLLYIIAETASERRKQAKYIRRNFRTNELFKI